MSAVWYIMEDGSVADPRDIAAGADGVLRHRDGRAVAYKPHGPRSRMVSDDEVAAYRGREMKPERPARAYKTRGSKAG